MPKSTAKPKSTPRRKPSGASVSMPPALRDRLYAAARAAGFNVQLGPRSQLTAFLELLVTTAEIRHLTRELPHKPARVAAGALLMYFAKNGGIDGKFDPEEMAEIIEQAFDAEGSASQDGAEPAEHKKLRELPAIAYATLQEEAAAA